MPAHLGGERKHHPQNLTERREIVLRNPCSQLDQLGRQDGLSIENRFDLPGLDRRSFFMQPGNHSYELCLTKGHDDAAADGRVPSGRGWPGSSLARIL